MICNLSALAATVILCSALSLGACGHTNSNAANTPAAAPATTPDTGPAAERYNAAAAVRQLKRLGGARVASALLYKLKSYS